MNSLDYNIDIELINNYMRKKIVVLTGAGISAESGIRTFRDTDGLWEEYRIEDVATPRAWKKNPELVLEFYNARRAQVIEAQPNDGHIYFAELGQHHDVTIITQNIDDLHERAGSEHIIHLHGNIRYSKSSGPKQESAYYPIEGARIEMTDLCPDGYVLRPHVVWFEEQVPMLEVAAEVVKQAEVLIIVGTSLAVYPAAGLAYIAPRSCAKFVIDPHVNELQIDSSFVKIAKGACEGVKELDELLKSV